MIFNGVLEGSRNSSIWRVPQTLIWGDHLSFSAFFLWVSRSYLLQGPLSSDLLELYKLFFSTLSIDIDAKLSSLHFPKNFHEVLISWIYLRKRVPGGASGREPACQFRRHKRPWFSTWVGKTSWRRAWQPTPLLLPGESHGHRNLVGYSP